MYVAVAAVAPTYVSASPRHRQSRRCLLPTLAADKWLVLWAIAVFALVAVLLGPATDSSHPWDGVITGERGGGLSRYHDHHVRGPPPSRTVLAPSKLCAWDGRL
jgi:hypothetical protein